MANENEEFYTARGYEMSANEDALTASMEDYLEMIYRLSRELGYTRVNDLAEHLNVQPPSVSKMMQKLHEKNLLNYEKYGAIHLSSAGEKLARLFVERHDILKEFLILMGRKEKLLKELEQIEHYISWDTFRGIYTLIEFFNKNEDIKKRFTESLANNETKF